MIHNDLAFPVVCGGVTSEPEVSYGMSLRDYFAAKTLAVVAAIYPEKNYEQWATYAYHLADEMLKARESKP